MPERQILSPDQWIGLAEDAWTEYLAEISGVFGAFWSRVSSTLGRVFTWRLLLVLLNPLIFAGPFYGGIAFDLIDAWRELSEDIGLAPRRAINAVVDSVIPVPDRLKLRVMRADEALRWAVRELLEFAADILDVDTPQWFDTFKSAKKIKEVEGLVVAFQAGEEVGERAAELGKKTIAFHVARALANLLLQVLSWGVVCGALLLIWRMHDEKSVLEFESTRCLSQDNPRLWVRRRVHIRVDTPPR